MSSKHLLRSFAGGEITPELAGRLDLVKYQTGLSLARNFITLPHGPAVRRTGFEFVRAAGDSTHKVRLIPFTFSTTQTAVVEFGHEYIRIHIDGATLIDPGTGQPYQISTPYAEADLFDLHYSQSADVITIVHPGYATRELRRLSATNWELSTVEFGPPASTPSLGVVPTIANSSNLTTSYYVATGVKEDGVTESLPSTRAGTSNNLSLAGNYNTITILGNGYARYNVYKLRGGVYGYIGQVKPSITGVARLIASYSRPYGSGALTITTTIAHGFSVGNQVVVVGCGMLVDGSYTVASVPNTTTLVVNSVYAMFPAYGSGGSVGTGSITMVDDNVQADTSQSPPEDIIDINNGDGDYPSATVYHEQRRWFAGTNSKPQVLWGTRTGTDSNFTSSLPTRDADGMELRVASSQYNQIRHLVALSDLIAFTAGGEFRIYAEGAPAITPTSVSIKPQGYAGASNVQPVVTTGSILYVQAQGSRIRELSYSWEANAYKTVDAAIMAPHRFNGYTITDLAYSRAPDSIMWAVRNDGTLLGMTYVPDQQVYGWHAHDTDGTFESVCVVPEENEDVLYAVVRREIGGTQLRYIERMRTRTLTDIQDAFYVDSGLSYSGTPVTTLSGLSHLNGKTVAILANGIVHPPRVVSGGSITLNYAASKVSVGLPITADLRTLPLAIEGAQAVGQGTLKNVNRVHLRVSQSNILKAGPDFARLRAFPAKTLADPYGQPPALGDGELSLSIDPSWNTDAAVCIRQDQPLPLNVLSMTLEIQTGG